MQVSIMGKANTPNDVTAYYGVTNQVGKIMHSYNGSKKRQVLCNMYKYQSALYLCHKERDIKE